jgi:hypothetical protein
MISHITFMLRSFDFVILSLLIPKKVTITKIHHLIRLNFERSEHKKSHCVLAFVALDKFFKQKLAFADKNQAQLTCFQQSDVKINFQR